MLGELRARRLPRAEMTNSTCFGPAAGERGVALIMALVILFVAVSVAGYLSVREHLAIERTAAVVDQAQARQYLYGVEEWVGATLSKDTKRTAWTSLDQAWARPLPPTPIGEGDVDTLEGYVEDLQGRFNLNNLVRNGKIDPLAQARFGRLLETLGLPATLEQPVVDWIGVHGAGTGGDTQDAYYLQLTPPYVAANRAFASVTTLRLVRGFTPAIYAKISPYLNALPTGTPINVNTAPAEVLRAIGLDASQAKAVVTARKRAPFTTLRAFTGAPSVAGAHFKPARLSVKSHYFAVHSRVTIGDETSLPYVSTLTVSPAGHMRVVSRTIAFETPPVATDGQDTAGGQ